MMDADILDAVSAADVDTSAAGRIMARVGKVCPRPADPLEVTAVLESLGYTDAVIAEETGLTDSLSLGRLLFDVLHTTGVEPPRRPATVNRRQDLQILLQTFSLSSIYALPWVVTFLVERWRPELLQVPQPAAAPLSLALMFSLIASGGFVQCIARKGTFYTGLAQAALGAEVSLRIWRLGVATLAATAIAAVAAAWYFEVFSLPYAALGAAFYVTFGLLWLTCGVLWLERKYWHVPLAFACGAVAFLAARVSGGTALEAQAAALGLAACCALALLTLSLRRHRRTCVRSLALPRLPVVARALAPYFCYGTGYFAFMFSDRLAAGSAVPTSSGLRFSVDGHYQAGMDVALLCFLVSMAGVEFLNYRFVQFWHREGARWTPRSGLSYRAAVRAAYLRSCAWIVGLFAAVALGVFAVPAVRQTLQDPLAWRVAACGLTGYLLLELSLFNALVLFSVNDPVPVLRALVAGFAADAIGGYIVSNSFGPFYASVAMAAGAALVLWRSSAAVRGALERPGYGCYVA